MRRHRTASSPIGVLLRCVGAAVLAAAASAAAAQPADAATRLARQAEAMRVFASLDGTWRGPATVVGEDGAKVSFVQTERIGPFLGGTVRVIEGRGYADDGRVRFNALGILSYDHERQAYTLHSQAQGRVGDFAFRPTADGYAWGIDLGPKRAIRYVATVRDGELHEVGDLVVEGREPVRVFEMRLRRLGDTDWPASGAIAPR